MEGTHELTQQGLHVLTTATLVGIGCILVALLVMAIIVRYTTYISQYPVRFVIEVLAVSVFASLPVFLIAKYRQSSYKRAFRGYLLLTLKFGLFWILTELAGINAVLFPVRKPKGLQI